LTELSLANGRRADVVGLSPGGDIRIVEIKSCLVDFQTTPNGPSTDRIATGAISPCRQTSLAT
jgi:hypothetical protein